MNICCALPGMPAGKTCPKASRGQAGDPETLCGALGDPIKALAPVHHYPCVVGCQGPPCFDQRNSAEPKDLLEIPEC